MNLSESKIVLGADFIDRLAKPLVPDRDVLDRDATPGNAGLTPFALR